jgi:hypothetical protein
MNKKEVGGNLYNLDKYFLLREWLLSTSEAPV